MHGPRSINTLNTMKRKGEKSAALTAYDALFAELISTSGIEVILVGDSLGMVLQGRDSTLPVTLDDMIYPHEYGTTRQQRVSDHGGPTFYELRRGLAIPGNCSFLDAMRRSHGQA